MKTKSFRKVLLGLSAAALSCMMVLSGVAPIFSNGKEEAQAEPASVDGIKDVTKLTDLKLSDYLNPSVTEKLPESVSDEREISVMVALDIPTVLDGYNELGATSMKVADFANSKEGRAIRNKITTESRQLQAQLNRKGIDYELGVSYDMLMSGFEIIIKAGDFEAVQKAVGKSAGVFISEEYERAVTYDVVENNVNVHDTGIFNSEGSEYDGSGTVIAVLDTGLDYTHDAFDVTRFNGDEVITQNSLREKVNLLTASKRTPGLTASDVYINKKVPFAYDYADSDPDVYPINEAHGTHVAGIIVGQSDPKFDDDGIDDNYIRGVAPNAQLAFFKVFSESIATAKQSWIIAALEDCITLEVDVINMSLGSSCGFAREVDDSERADVYDAVKEHGISLVCAGSNDGSAAQGSEKNGSLPLSSNPDTATVGAPSTYDSALSVASISGVKTPYMLLDGEIIYFTNARDFAGEEKKFVDEILAADGSEEKEIEYVIINTPGDESNYSGVDVKGKIAVVERGVTNFEDKAQIAKDHGAIGCIIYNNVSGDITMTIGSTDLPTCSLDRDSGRKFIKAASSVGKIKISKKQVAGPFMSDFSSWGPRPDLGIKPEITAHGGDILSCIHGQRYDRYSGTSMASPNQAGFTALVRQYVKSHFSELTPLEVTAMVNQLMMSTTDIALNPAGIPFSVRKQGSGLANLDKATSTPAFIRTYDRYTGELSDKAKLELGDDPQKTGEKEFKFEIKNISGNSVSYDLGAIIQTEGISEQLTYRGDTTITEKGYILEGARITLQGVENGTASGNTVTVAGNATAVVTAKITVSDTDKEYMDSQFKNGIYVEGFVTLTSKDKSNCDLNVPFLSFYGSWTQAPLLDLDYFETYADEENDILTADEKTLPDFASTRPVGKLYGDYIAYLGTFPYQMDPSSTLIIGAEREKIALTNQEGEYGGINELNGINFGLLRGAKRMDVSITDSSTGEVIWTKTKYNLMKSYYSGGAHIYFPMDLDFNVRDHNLKNNTRYDVKAVGYLDYGDGGSDNVKNVFEFPFYTDFEAPVATGVKYSYEYDYDTKTNRLYAEVSIYDNQYLMGYIAGAMGRNDEFDRNDPNSYMYTTSTFTSYVNPVLGQRNTTNIVRIELTDQLDRIKESHDGRSFIVQCMDYALNSITYEFTIPDEVTSISFPEMEKDENGNAPGVTISPNESYRLAPETFPSQDVVWRETINYTSSNENVVKVENGQLLGIAKGEAIVTAESAYEVNGTRAKAELKVTVLGPDDPGYQQFDKPTAEEFYLDGYWAEKIFYSLDPADRGLGIMETYNDSGERNYLTLGRASAYAVEMFPSESVQLNPVVKGFFGEDNYRIRYSSTNPLVVDVTDKGVMTAKNVRDNGDGTYTPQNTVRSAIVNINLDARDENGDWKQTFYSTSISVRVKKPYINSGAWLVSYKGLGGTVDIPASLKLTTINSYAFSNFEFVDKDLSAGDVIDEEDPYSMKQWFIGESSIEKVIIPEGVETIEAYAFAGLTGLKEVVLPSTLYKIQIGAFYGCTALEKVSFSSENHLQFINEKGFYNCTHLNDFDFSAMIGIGKSTFENTGLMNIKLPVVGSISDRSFAGCEQLTAVTIESPSVKLGNEAFADCGRLTSININAKVISSGAFDNCKSLKDVTLGRDVEVIGQYAFRYTQVTSFVVDAANTEFKAMDGGKYLVDAENRLALVAPMQGSFTLTDSNVTTVGKGAFSTAGSRLVSINLPSVTVVEDYAFANCSALSTLTLGTLTSVGEGAFRGTTSLTKLPNLAENATIGNYAFAESGIADANLTNVKQIGSYAFAYAPSLTKVVIGNDTEVGECAFFGAYKLAEVTIGDNSNIGAKAFSGLHITEFYNVRGIEVTDERMNYYNTTAKFKYNGYDMNITIMPYVSAISKLKIGNNVTLGERAFFYAGSMAFGAATTATGNNTIPVGGTLEEVTFGEGTSIGDYAFYGCANIKTLNGIEKVKSIGDYAFAGETQGYLVFSNGILEVEKINMSPKVETLDLSGAEFIGKGAFAGVDPLKSVILGASLEKLGVSNKVVDPDEKVYVVDPLELKIDAGVFEGCDLLESVNLENVLEIGEGAFAGTKLTGVTLREGVKIGDRAFQNVETLTSAANLPSATEIGKEAFERTSIECADVVNASYIGDFAFAYSKVNCVYFGHNLVSVGENPFAGCAVTDFTRDGSDTFDFPEGKVKVVESALYRANGKGYELISFPMNKQVKSVTVADKTYRIGKEAFYGAKIEVVNLAREVASIGHKAFYGCDNLILVNFRSIQAPRLEEEFDASYETEFTETGTYKYMEQAFGRVVMTYTDGRTEIDGLGFVDSLMWSPDATCVFYGANFVANLTDEKLKEHTLVMVRPSNGSGYENFTYNIYFDQVVLGRGAITDVAQTVIDMLDVLPNELSDRDYDTVYTIYNLYGTLGMEDQNYLNAEGYAQRLSNAKRIVDSFRTPTTPGGDENNPSETPTNNTPLYVVLGLVGAGLVIAIVVYFVKRKSNGDSDGSDEKKSE